MEKWPEGPGIVLHAHHDECQRTLEFERWARSLNCTLFLRSGEGLLVGMLCWL